VFPSAALADDENKSRDKDVADVAPTLAREAFLRTEIKAARSREFYLVLDPAADALLLRLQHVDLLTMPVRAEFGWRRWARRGELVWPALACTLLPSVAEPERPLLTPPRRDAADTTAAPAITVEAIQAAREQFMLSLPARYELRFTTDLDVLVAGETPQTGLRGRWRQASRQFAEAWDGLKDALARRTPRVRLVLHMTPEDARRLYLALVPRMPLLIAPPGPSGS